jgi:serine/threonine-protein kinase RsbT
MEVTAELTDSDQAVVAISAETDLIQVRRVLRAAAQDAGLGLVDSTKLITAGSELTRNILTYATGSRGTLRAKRIHETGRLGVRAVFTDDGPGIGDIETALTDGFSTGGSMGLGLPGSQRLVDEMSITSAASGTTVTVIKWSR